MFYKRFPQKNPSSLKYAVVLPSNDNSAPVSIALSIANAAFESGLDVTVYWLTNVNSGQICYDDSTNNYFSMAKYNIIHSHLLRPDLICFVLRILFVLRRLAARSTPRFISTIHSDFKYELSLDRNYFVALFASYVWISALKYLDIIVFTSETIRKVFSGTFDKSYVIHNGVNFERVNSNSRLIDGTINAKINTFKNSDDVLVGYIGGLRAIKGIDYLVRAFAQLPIVYKLVIIGSGYELSKLKELILEFDLVDRVLFLGHVDNPYAYARQFKLIVFPSLSEAFCLAAVEASYVAGNIVTSNIPTFVELLPNKIFPKFISHSPECISACISDCVETIHQKYSSQKDFVLKHYSSVLMGERYCKIFSGLHDGHALLKEDF